MAKVQNFSEHIEKSFERLGKHVEERVETRAGENVPEREVVRESLQSFAKEIHETKEIGAPTNGASPSQPSINTTAIPSYLNKESEDVKKTVEMLVEEAFSGGLEKAVNKARKYPAFIEDAFHDALVDALLPELKRRGMLK